MTPFQDQAEKIAIYLEQRLAPESDLAMANPGGPNGSHFSPPRNAAEEQEFRTDHEEAMRLFEIRVAIPPAADRQSLADLSRKYGFIPPED